MDEQNRSRLKRILQTISQQLIQEIPPELSACEICRKTECSQDEWIVCENRIAHAKCLEESQGKTRF
jgi:hypothetical protein